MRSCRNRTAGRAPGSATSRPSSRAGASAWSTAPAGLAGGGLQHAELSAAAQAGHRLQHGPGLLRQGGGRRRQQPGHLGPAQVRAHRRLIPPPPGRCRSQQAIAAQRVEQLHRLVRVAARMRLDHRGQARGRGLVHAQHLGDHRGQARLRQVAQPQMPHPGPSRHRDSGAANTCAASTSSSRYAPTSSSPSIRSSLSTRSTRPRGVRPAHCRSSRNTTSGRLGEATARNAAAPARCTASVRSADPRIRRHRQ